MAVSVLDEPYHPFYSVPPKEQGYTQKRPPADKKKGHSRQHTAHGKHFLLLPAVYLFVMVCHRIVPARCAVAHKDKRPNGHGQESLEGDDVVEHYSHGYMLL
jgi:hypothetical protein